MIENLVSQGFLEERAKELLIQVEPRMARDRKLSRRMPVVQVNINQGGQQVNVAGDVNANAGRWSTEDAREIMIDAEPKAGQYLDE